MHGGRVLLPRHHRDVLHRRPHVLIGIGTLREPTVEVLLAALDAGVGLVDTADVYGEAESVVASARALRPAAPLTIVTKGGLIRRAEGPWAADGRARHLEEAAVASAARLGVAPDLYLLHAPDPNVPLATSVRALQRLKDEGVVRAIGVGNVRRGQLEEALAIAPEIAAVEVELSPWDVHPVRGGLVSLCVERGIQVLAYRPLGGPDRAKRLGRDVELAAIAARLGATPQEVALAWLRRLGVVPIPGATRIETAVSVARAGRLALDDDAAQALDARWLGIVQAGAAPRRAGEVVIVMGIPAAGKSTAIADLVERGYLRLNRDERGGTLDKLAGALDRALAEGASCVVLDNTYPTRSSRAPVIAAARRHGVAARCVWLDTPIEEAQHNAVVRLLDKHGRLLESDELKREARRDPGTFPPGVQFRWRRELEPPALDEGFDAVEVTPFVRRRGGGSRRGVILELSALGDGAEAAIARDRAAGWHVVATGWQDGVAPPAAGGLGPSSRSASEGETWGSSQEPATAGVPGREQWGLEVAWCRHPAGPPACWCRKPLPGLGLVLARAHDLDLGASVHVGRSPADRGFALRLGVRFVDVDEWLAG